MTAKADFGKWFDVGVLCDVIRDTLSDAGIPSDTKRLKAVWLDFLYTELSSGLKRSVCALADNGEL